MHLPSDETFDMVLTPVDSNSLNTTEALDTAFKKGKRELKLRTVKRNQTELNGNLLRTKNDQKSLFLWYLKQRSLLYLFQIARLVRRYINYMQFCWFLSVQDAKTAKVEKLEIFWSYIIKSSISVVMIFIIIMQSTSKNNLRQLTLVQQTGRKFAISVKRGGIQTIILFSIFSILLSCASAMPPKKTQLSINYYLHEEMDEHLNEIQYIIFPSQSDFRNIVLNKKLIVDKSLLIKDLIDYKQNAILITRPRRWGKSLNMNMVYCFFNMEVDQKGQVLNPQPQYLLFEGSEKEQLSPLLIAKHTDWQQKYSKQQGNYPVIYMSWKHIKPMTYEQFYRDIQQQISLQFQKYYYLYNKLIDNKDPRSQPKQKKFQHLLNKSSDKYILQKSLLFLSQLLQEYHKRKVYILIDQYDAPFNFMLQNYFQETDPQIRVQLAKEKKKVSFMIRLLLQAVLKDNPCLKQGILTGIFDTLQKEGHSGLNNIDVYGITQDRYSQHYGFSYDQIKRFLVVPMFKESLFIDANIQNKKYELQQKILDRVTDWYNGYIVTGVNKKLYNPYAVVKYLSRCASSRFVRQGQAFWSMSGSDLPLKYMFSQALSSNLIHKVSSLIQSYENEQDVVFELSPSFSLADIQFQTSIKQESFACYLLNSGYITGIVHFQQELQKLVIRAKIPNLEIKQVFQLKFTQWIKDITGVSLHQHTFDPISVLNGKSFTYSMGLIFNQNYKKMAKKNEAWFNGLISAIYFFSRSRTHTVSVEVASGAGYSDHIFLPMEQFSNVAVIHEYKFSANHQQIESKLREAYLQMYNNRYMQSVIKVSPHRGIKTIIMRAIVIVDDSLSQGINLQLGPDFQHTIEEAITLNRFFQEHKVHAKNNIKVDQLNYLLRSIIQAKEQFLGFEIQKLPRKKKISEQNFSGSKNLHARFLTIQPDPLQEVFRRIDRTQQARLRAQKQQQTFVGLNQQTHANSRRFPIQSDSSLAATTQVLIDPWIARDQKTINQARFYRRTGVLFSSLRRGLIEGAIRIIRRLTVGYTWPMLTYRHSEQYQKQVQEKVKAQLIGPFTLF